MDNKANIKILVACHKADPAIRQDGIYMPIHVGKSMHPDIDLGFQGDNTGDNISDKNGSYCELTALYWVWKNLPKDVDIVGLCHYRRYFKLDAKDPHSHIDGLLKKHDAVILPDHVREISNIGVLTELTCQEDTALFIDLLIEKYPQWKDTVGRYFYQSNRASWCNMMIMRREIMDRYCDFLFSFLHDLESTLLPIPYTRIVRRMGYFAEMLLGFWLQVNGYSVSRIGFDDDNENRLMKFQRTIRHNLSFYLFRHKPFQVYYATYIGLKQDGRPLKHIKPGKSK